MLYIHLICIGVYCRQYLNILHCIVLYCNCACLAILHWHWYCWAKACIARAWLWRLVISHLEQASLKISSTRLVRYFYMFFKVCFGRLNFDTKRKTTIMTVITSVFPKFQCIAATRLSSKLCLPFGLARTLLFPRLNLAFSSNPCQKICDPLFPPFPLLLDSWFLRKPKNGSILMSRFQTKTKDWKKVRSVNAFYSPHCLDTVLHSNSAVKSIA